jgi:hypothetical protein
MKHSSLATLFWHGVLTGCWLVLACGSDRNVAARQMGNSLSQTTATAERRVALVIGNSDYGKQRLATTRHDAREVAAALRELGFEVTLGEDVSQAEFRQLLSKFREQTRKEGVGLVYFAGIGAQFNGSNWLLPVRAKFKSTAQLKTTAISVEEVHTALTARINLLLFDASRITPLLRTKPPGLASLSAPADTLIAFAAQPGTTTLDPKGQPHSPYTASLLQHLRTQGLSLTTLFDRVRAEVASATKKRQTPWEASGLRSEFSLNPLPKPVAVIPASENNEIAQWQAIANSINPADFQAYLAKYPKGIYADSARVKLQQLTGKDETKTSASDSEPVSVSVPSPELFTTTPQTPPTETEAKTETEKVPGPAATLPGNRSSTSAVQARVERLFYDACYVQKNEPVCCQLAVDLISKFPDTIYGREARKRTGECPFTTAWESFLAALSAYYAAPDSTKLEKLFSTGEAFLRLSPDYPYVVAQMALAGSSAALGELYKDKDKSKRYVEKALKLFDPSALAPADEESKKQITQFRDYILALGNQYLGWYTIQTNGDPKQALEYLGKSIAIKTKPNLGWKDPNNYWLRSTIYNNEYARLGKQYAALTAEQKESDEGKALLTQLNQSIDKLIVEYARVIAVAIQPFAKPLRDAARESLQPLWKHRHGSLAGMEEFIRRYEKDPSVA